MEVSGYTDAAPVSLDSYRRFLAAQLDSLPVISPEKVSQAIADLVLPEEAAQVAALAGSSPRSLFIFGPPGNGKTSLGHLLHDAMDGYLARSFDMESVIGAYLDPIADKLLLTTAYVVLTIDKRLP